jgi:hypothetical protein
MLDWFCVYLLVTGFYSAIFSVAVMIHLLFSSALTETMLGIVGFGFPIVFMGIGVVSLLPLSEYRYMKQAGINPAIARESVQSMRRKPEKKELGILVGLVGLAIVFRFDPWLAFFFLVSPFVGVTVTTILIIVVLSISIVMRSKRRIMMRT